MRVLRVLSRMNLGGPARQVLAADPILVGRGHEVRLLAGTPEAGEGDLFEEARAAGLDAVRIPGLGRAIAPLGDFRARRAVSVQLERFAPDVLHTHASKAGWIGRRAARAFPRVATVHTFHGHVLEGYFPGPLSRRLVALERRLAAGTDRIAAVSHATLEDLVRLGVAAEERIVVVPPGVDLAPFLALPARRQRTPAESELRRTLCAEPGDSLVGVIGRLAPVKQPELALAAFALLAPRYPKLHMVFAGDGSERRRLEAGILQLPSDVGRRAHLLGALPRTDALLGELDAVLLSSRSEGLPVALIEAAAAALPVVSFAVGGVEELVAHERTGLLVPPGEGSDGLAFALAQLLDDPRSAAAMGERARLKVAARHGGEALAARLESLYAAVIEERRCAS